MSLIDEAILKAFPLLAVPASGGCLPAAEYGTRYLVAREGIAREITLPWVRMCAIVAPSVLPLPYGAVEEAVEFRCGSMPAEVIRAFVADARNAYPLEVAGVCLWNEVTGGWRYETRRVIEASGAHVRYEEVRPLQNEHIVVDVHSHGQYPAFFSAEDDADDSGAMKVSLVLGNLDQERPTTKMRLCMAGLIQPAYLNGNGQLGVAA